MKRTRIYRTAIQGVRSGFTLIEVLATIVLLGIVLPIAMQGVSIAMSAGSNAKRSVEAVSLAETKLDELVASREWQLGTVSGDFAPDFPTYRWQLDIVNQDTYLTELTIRVTWSARGAERYVDLSTLVFTGAEDLALQQESASSTGTAGPGGGL